MSPASYPPAQVLRIPRDKVGARFEGTCQAHPPGVTAKPLEVLLRFEDVRDVLQPKVDDDLDALYGAYVQETGGEDVSGFVKLLHEGGVINDEMLEALQGGTLATPPKVEESTEWEQNTASEDVDDAPTAAPNDSEPESADDGSDEAEEEEAESQASAEPASSESTEDEPSGNTTDSGTYVLGDDGSNTNPDAGKRQRRRGTGSSTGETRQRRRGTGSSTGASEGRRRTTGPRRAMSQQALVAGKGYQYLGELGKGAMGAVNRMKDLDLNRQVAFKTMSPEIAATPLASKFIGEAQITAQLQHPNIIPIYGLEQTGKGELAYSMKLVDGRTFEDLIHECQAIYDEKKPMDEDHSLMKRVERFILVCEAIHYGHLRGVVHRDLKPENLMIGPYDEIYVMDWGIAKLMENPPTGGKEQPVNLEHDPDDDGDLIIGTPQYMSPEQAHGKNDELDGFSDQYALGLIFFELVSLTQAVTGKAPLKIVMRQQDGEKNPLVHYAGDKIPPELAAVVHKTTALDPKDRYPSCAALAEDLRRYMRGEETIAKPDTMLQKFFRWVQRHRELTLTTVMGMFMLGAMLVIGLIGYQFYQSVQNAAREERVSEIVTLVGSQAAQIDGTFVRYEGLLGLVAATASDSLNETSGGDATEQQAFWAKQYDENAGPADTEKSARYGMPVSFEEPVYVTSPDVTPDDVSVNLRVEQLAPMRRHYRKVLLRSKDEQAGAFTGKRADRILRDVGVPLAWVHIGLKNGLYTTYPGHGAYPDTFDPQKRPWYKLGEGEDIPTWGAPYPDPYELGRILPCSIGLKDREGEYIGVASIELTFEYIIEELLEIEQLFTTRVQNDSRSEAFLVDKEGRIVVQSSKKDVKVRGGFNTRELRLPDFPMKEIREEIDNLNSGNKVVDGQFVFYQRMQSTGWYYVVVGDERVMLEKNSK